MNDDAIIKILKFHLYYAPSIWTFFKVMHTIHAASHIKLDDTTELAVNYINIS